MKLSECFSYYADLLEIKGEENKFKIKAYRNIVTQLNNSVELENLKGVGSSLKAKIKTYQESGKCPWVEAIESEFSREELSAIKTFCRIEGFGLVGIRKLLHHQIYSLEEALQSSVVTDVQKKSIIYHQDIQKPLSLNAVKKHIDHINDVLQIGLEGVGKYRRKIEPLYDIEVLCDHSFSMEEILQKLIKDGYVRETYKRGEKRMEVFVKLPYEKSFKKMVLYNSKNFYVDLFRLTGPYEYTRNFTLPEFAFNELNIFSLNDVEYIPPEFRDLKYDKSNACLWEQILLSDLPLSKIYTLLESSRKKFLISKILILYVLPNTISVYDYDYNLIDYSVFNQAKLKKQFQKLLFSLEKYNLTIYSNFFESFESEIKIFKIEENLPGYSESLALSKSGKNIDFSFY